MDQAQLKLASANAALKYIGDDCVVGVGTGSTVNLFIDALTTIKNKIEYTVASSVESEKRLKEHGIPVVDLNAADKIDVYIDGADEFNPFFYLTKGRGGALTREKIIASAAQQFVCIVDDSKRVDVLGSNAAIPIEVIPMARSYVGREIVKLGANPMYREGYKTDNGNIIIDAYGFTINEPLKLESTLNNIPGVVENGIFAHRPADIVIVAAKDGVSTLKRGQ